MSSTVDSFAYELEPGDVVNINSESWRVLAVDTTTQPGLVYVSTDHDTLTLPNTALVEIVVDLEAA